MARMETWMKLAGLALMVMALAVGCETSALEDQGTITLAELEGQTPEPVVTNENGEVVTDVTDETDTGGDEGTGGESEGEDEEEDGGGGSITNGWPAEIDGSIKWLHTNVSSWPITTSIRVSFSGKMINFPYDKSRVWPAVDGVNGNPWVIAKIDGQWYAATFEWLGFGQTSKPKATVGGGNIKKSPMSGDWAPASGQRVGIMVSGLARSQTRNVKERSNVVMITWP